MTYVLDTSAILSRRFNIARPDIIIPDSVVDEIRKGRLKAVLDAMDETISVRAPSIESVRKVEKKAEESGDLRVMSRTDIDVIALALETGGTLISDDFAIQNVASLLSVEFMGADLGGISQQVIWNYRCTGCRKVYGSPVKQCPVCGHEVVRTRKGSRRKGVG